MKVDVDLQGYILFSDQSYPPPFLKGVQEIQETQCNTFISFWSKKNGVYFVGGGIEDEYFVEGIGNNPVEIYKI